MICILFEVGLDPAAAWNEPRSAMERRARSSTGALPMRRDANIALRDRSEVPEMNCGC